MKKNEEIRLKEIEALSEFEEHIEVVLKDMEIYREHLNKRELKKLEKCYDYLDNLWEQIEDTISTIISADDREKSTYKK